MGWNINLVENTVKVPEEFREKLFAAGQNEHFFGAADDIMDDGELVFDQDSMEHMDYLWDRDILAVLAEAKVNGRVVFSSGEGDNAGEIWSHTFTNGVVETKRGFLKDLAASF